MSTPHPADAVFADAYSIAWTRDPVGLLDFFAPDGTYTDVAMDGTYRGHEEIGKFHRFMLRFAPDSVIEFRGAQTVDGHLYAEWEWSGTAAGPLRLRSGKIVDATGKQFAVPGIAVCEYDAHGKLISHRDYWDLGTVLEQASIPIG